MMCIINRGRFGGNGGGRTVAVDLGVDVRRSGGLDAAHHHSIELGVGYQLRDFELDAVLGAPTVVCFGRGVIGRAGERSGVQKTSILGSTPFSFVARSFGASGHRGIGASRHSSNSTSCAARR